jgi:hypothetical protein
MNLKTKNKSNTKKIPTKKSSASDTVGNYEKHPFFIKKANSVKNLLLEVGLPKDLIKRNHAS